MADRETQDKPDVRATAQEWAERLDTVALPISAGDGKRVRVKGWQRLDAETLAEHDHWGDAGAAYGLRLDGLTCLDVDDIAAFDSEVGFWDRQQTLIVTTGRGAHLIYRGESQSGNYPWGSVKSGASHYIVGPESVRDDGVAYKVASGTDPAPVAEIPDLGEPVRVAAVDSDGPIEEGGRDNALTSIAGRLRRAGASAAAVEVHLAEINRERCKPPLSTADVKRIAQSVARYEPEREISKVKAAVKPAHDAAAAVADLLLEARPAPQPPTVCADDDGHALLFGGQATAVYGRPGQGKSWVGTALARQTVETGGRVLMICPDGGQATHTRTKRAIGTHGAVLFTTSVQVYCERMPDLTLWLAEAPRSLIVFDSVTAAGCPTDGENFAAWYQAHIGFMMHPARAVLLIDHARKNRGRGPQLDDWNGSTTKAGHVDAAYQISDKQGSITATNPRELTRTKTRTEQHPPKWVLSIVRGIPTVTSSGALDAGIYARVDAGEISQVDGARTLEMDRSKFLRGLKKYRKSIGES